MKSLLVLTWSLSLFACGSDDSNGQAQNLGSRPADTAAPSAVSADVVTEQAVVATYAANLHQAYADAVVGAEALQTAISAFLNEPNETTLTAARKAWIDSRLAYMQTEGARFYGGPIDNPETNYEAQLNSWPLDEANVDYTLDPVTNTADDTTGIINRPDLYPTITAENLVELNGQGGDENITVGYHAIEFLLWGQATTPVGPGERKATDYVVGPGATHKNAERRRTYLHEVTRLLIDTLVLVRDAWAPGAPTNYRAAFVSGEPKKSLEKILVGLGKMSKGELASQRILASYLSKDRQDQHNCFSALTLIDYERNALGMQNMYFGRYGATAGPGVADLVQAKDPALHEKMSAQLQASRDALANVPPPFEQAFLGSDDSEGRKKLSAVIDALRTQADTLVEVADALGLQINVPETNN